MMWFPMMWFFPLIFLVFLLVYLFRGGNMPMCGMHGMRGGDHGTSSEEGNPREILDRRFARGEINPEEYDRMKKELESSAEPSMGVNPPKI